MCNYEIRMIILSILQLSVISKDLGIVMSPEVFLFGGSTGKHSGCCECDLSPYQIWFTILAPTLG